MCPSQSDVLQSVFISNECNRERTDLPSTLAFPDGVRSTAIRDRVVDSLAKTIPSVPGFPPSLPRRLRPGTQVKSGKRNRFR